MLCNCLVQTLQCFLKNLKKFLGHEKIKNLASKVAYFYGSLEVFFFLSEILTALNSPEVNIRFIDSCIQ